MKSSNQKSLYVALIGAPNAGKSTLLNRLIGAKISIVSPKVQTTRNIINGIVVKNDVQLIFVDTPGIFKPNSKKILEKKIVKAAWDGALRADQVAMLLDGRKGITTEDEMLFEALTHKDLKPIIIINKIDIAKKNNVEALEAELKQHFPGAMMFRISAITGEGEDNLVNHLKNIALPMPWPYEEDDMTTVPVRFIAAEITREVLYFSLDQELPYAIKVESESWQEQNGKVRINQVIYVNRESQKMIILGKGGQMIKKIGEQARKEIANIVGVPVSLFLFVKVRDDWQESEIL